MVSFRLKYLDPDKMIEVLSADMPRDIQLLKLVAEELDNDSGRGVYTAIYDGVETASDIAARLGLSVQLIGYHVEKLLLAGLVEERVDSKWLSEKGREMRHYVPSKAAILVVPSLSSLRSNKEARDRTRSAFGDLARRILPSLLLGFAAFLGVGHLMDLQPGMADMTASGVVSNVPNSFGAAAGHATFGGVALATSNASAAMASILALFPSGPLPVLAGITAGAAVGYLSFRLWPRRRAGGGSASGAVAEGALPRPNERGAAP